MKQKLTSAGRAALQRQLCAPSNFLNPDAEIIERMMQAREVYFWEGTAMELPCAAELMHRGIAALQPEPGWDIESAAMLVTADSSADLSLGMMEDLTSLAIDHFGGASFTFGTAFADLDIGTLRLVLAAAVEPVRVPESLTKLSLGTLSILVGGTRRDRERLLGDFVGFSSFVTDLLLAVNDGDIAGLRARWWDRPQLAISEAQLIDGEERTAMEFSKLLLHRFHHDLPTLLGMRYIPVCFEQWFPMERMRRETPEFPASAETF